MKLTITGKQTRVTDDMRKQAEQKLKKFEKFFGDDAEANVTYYHTKRSECAEITIHYKGTIFRSEVEDSTYRCALDRAEDRIEGQIRKNKTRLERRLRAGAFDSYADEEQPEEEPEFRIRVKEFPMKPMSTEEAILQMNLTSHSFFVFIDDKTGNTNVVYKRHEDEYGLLIPTAQI